jgi:hypothetical protein
MDNNPNHEPLFEMPEDETNRPEPFPVPKIITELSELEEGVILPVGAVYGLSDLSGQLLEEFAAGWPTVPVENRRKAVRFLAETCESNYELTYRSLAYIAFEDEDPEVRAAAPDLLWFDTSERLYHKLMELADDVSPAVRARAVSHMGRFIYEAELDEFDQQLAEQAKDVAADRFYDVTENLEVRRRALEALSQGGHPSLKEMIVDAYDSAELLMRVSAVFAMGSSCDKEQWGESVLYELDSEYPEIRFEAARAAGELVLPEAVPQLIALAHENDEDIRLNAVMSLGEIGSMEAQRGLSQLAEIAEENDDVATLEAVEEALEFASLMGGLVMPMFEFDEDDPLAMDDFDEDTLDELDD